VFLDEAAGFVSSAFRSMAGNFNRRAVVHE
jgi:hypothetical protein